MPISKYQLLKQCLRQLCGQNPETELIQKWAVIYGPFDNEEYTQYTFHNLPSESAHYHCIIIHLAQMITPAPMRTLLAGEAKQAAKELVSIMDLGETITAGVLDVDIPWNFEKQAPQMGKFNLIISQAILEHLLDPYQHMLALHSLLEDGGHLLLHTVTPGFVYHRYPIDSCRFYPDFFETFAQRNCLKVCKRRVHDNHIFYLFQKKRPGSQMI